MDGADDKSCIELDKSGLERDTALRVPSFPFDSPLASAAVTLERLRGDLSEATTATPAVAELSKLYRFMSSVVSARIEGNRTTILDAVRGAHRQASQPHMPVSDTVQEILRLEEASAYCEDRVRPGTPITHVVIRELHAIVTRDLIREGDQTPGEYRRTEVGILGSSHVPPLASTVHAHMTALLDFANQTAPPHMHLIRMAIAHHRFVWIHPFTNGNGRVARLFSYALIRSCGFAPDIDVPTINPTSVFGADRAQYYSRLAAADSLHEDALIDWSTYVLEGLGKDLSTLRELLRDGAVRDLVVRATTSARDSAILTTTEAAALEAVADGQPFKAGKLRDAIPQDASTRSRVIASLLDRGLITRLQDGGRVYSISLAPNDLTPFVIVQLDSIGLVPNILKDPTTSTV